MGSNEQSCPKKTRLPEPDKGQEFVLLDNQRVHTSGGTGFTVGDLALRRHRYTLAHSCDLCRHRQRHGRLLLGERFVRQECRLSAARLAGTARLRATITQGGLHDRPRDGRAGNRRAQNYPLPGAPATTARLLHIINV